MHSHLIERGDIVDQRYTPEPAVGRYQGNGRFGTVYSKLGLHPHPSQREAWDAHGHHQLMHMKHWGRFHFHSDERNSATSADYLLPLANIYWERLPAEVSGYSQHQSFHDGLLTTRFVTETGSQVGITTWFDPVARNLAGIEIDLQGEPMPLVVAAVTSFIPYAYGYSRPAAQRFTVQPDGDQWRIDITSTDCQPPVTSSLYVKTDAQVQAHTDGLLITPREGRNTVFISHGEPVPAGAPGSREVTTNHWHDTWRNSAAFDFPDERSQQTWVRSLAYILSTFNDDGIGFTPTNGLSGNLYMFNFVQDMFYVHPALLASGHLGVAKSWIERFAGMIPEMRDYAQRLWPQTKGIYPPWELPFGPLDTYHAPSVPIVYCYEPHNAAYLARMAHDTALVVDDAAWRDTFAKPLIDEIAQFYKSFIDKEADGLWHAFLTPSVGQDEAGGRDQKDYLCVLYSARYAFQKAIEYGLDADGAYARMLADGLAFEPLLCADGFYGPSGGYTSTQHGTQKHPVQLNGLAYLPSAPGPITAETTAYAQRYRLTERATEPYFFGWTLGEFLVASSHLGDVDGWRQDWHNVAASAYTDPDWVQLYESSARPDSAFYVTTSGLVVQSLIENIVCDYWGELRIAACNPYAATVRFHNVKSRLGVAVSGQVHGRSGKLEVTAWKDCTLKVNGTELTLRQGEQRSLDLAA